MTHRCATGEHRGDTLLECAARLQATSQIVIDNRCPRWELLVACVRAGRDLWPHLCLQRAERCRIGKARAHCFPKYAPFPGKVRFVVGHDRIC